jgi:ABC-type multidrug transport system fused ATPase/permease subunit
VHKSTGENIWVKKYFLPSPKEQIYVAILRLTTVPFALVGPYIAKLIIDKAYVSKDAKLFFTYIFWGIFCFVVLALVNVIANYRQAFIKNKIKFDLNNDLFLRLQQLPLASFQQRASSEYLYKLEYDSERVSDFIAGILPKAFKLFPEILSIIVIVLLLDLRIAAFLFCSLPFLYLNIHIFGKRLRAISLKLVSEQESIFKRLSEIFRYSYLVKVFGQGEDEAASIKSLLKSNMDLKMKEAKLQNVNSLFGSITLMNIVFAAVIAFAGLRLIKGETTLGNITALALYFMQLVSLQAGCINFFQEVMINGNSRKRLSEILTYSGREGQDIRWVNKISKPEIEFNNVTFKYQGGKNIFEDASFKIPAGVKIGLVGTSGKGKTTLVNLILRLCELEKGSILIDNTDINKIESQNLYSQIAIATQEPILWDDTVENNIKYGKPGASMEEVISSARLCLCDEFIKELPLGYRASVKENAALFSEGQKQRIAIARAVIKRPQILILDEALASLDSQTEDELTDNIIKEFKNSTVIFVSHRLSTIKKTEWVCFLEAADKILVDTHERLLGNAKYRELFSSQIN